MVEHVSANARVAMLKIIYGMIATRKRQISYVYLSKVFSSNTSLQHRREIVTRDFLTSDSDTFVCANIEVVW